MVCVFLHAGPGRAWSAKEQGQYLFKLANKKERFISAPVGLMDGIIGCFDGLTRFFPGLEVSFPAVEHTEIWLLSSKCCMVGPAFSLPGECAFAMSLFHLARWLGCICRLAVMVTMCKQHTGMTPLLTRPCKSQELAREGSFLSNWTSV